MTGISPASLMQMRSQILSANQALSRVAATGPQGPVSTGGVEATGKADFTSALKGALDKVSGLQNQASAVSEAYEKGEVTDIAQVMLSRETANVGFQATLQVRNKLLSAYKDIMSMPV